MDATGVPLLAVRRKVITCRSMMAQSESDYLLPPSLLRRYLRNMACAEALPGGPLARIRGGGDHQSHLLGEEARPAPATQGAGAGHTAQCRRQPRRLLRHRGLLHAEVLRRLRREPADAGGDQEEGGRQGRRLRRGRLPPRCAAGLGPRRRHGDGDLARADVRIEEGEGGVHRRKP